MHDLHTKTALDKKALQFTYSRLQSLLRTLEISSLEEFNPLQDVANFATLVSTYADGFSVILEPRVSVSMPLFSEASLVLIVFRRERRWPECSSLSSN
jgi:hypothetical protein